MKSYRKRFISLFFIITAAVMIRYFIGGDLLTLENLQANSDRLREYVSEHAATSYAVYVLIYVAVTALSLPGAAVLTLSGGFLFGVFGGALLANLGASSGAVMAFLMSRYFLGEWVHAKYGERLARFNRDLEVNGRNYLLTLRLIPAVPFFLINIFAGLTRIPLWTFAWTTVVGIIPGSLVYSFAGRQMASIRSAGDILSGNMIAAFLLLALFSLVPVIYRRLRPPAPTTL